VAVLGDFVRIYCAANHGERDRRRCTTDAAQLGVYGRKVPDVCDECESHLAYAEQRRAACPRDPKPFCAHCDTQCYRASELDWQRTMMRYSGPRSWYRGHLIDSIRHAAEAMRYRRTAAANAAGQTTD
jgi:hypothetical protein